MRRLILLPLGLLLGACAPGLQPVGAAPGARPLAPGQVWQVSGQAGIYSGNATVRIGTLVRNASSSAYSNLNAAEQLNVFAGGSAMALMDADLQELSFSWQEGQLNNLAVLYKCVIARPDPGARTVTGRLTYAVGGRAVRGHCTATLVSGN